MHEHLHYCQLISRPLHTLVCVLYVGASHRAAIPAIAMSQITMNPEQERLTNRKYTFNVNEGTV